MKILQLLTRVNIVNILPFPKELIALLASIFFPPCSSHKHHVVGLNFGKFLKDFDHVCSLLNKQLQQRTWFTQQVQVAAIFAKKLKGASFSRNVNTQFNVTRVLAEFVYVPFLLNAIFFLCTCSTTINCVHRSLYYFKPWWLKKTLHARANNNYVQSKSWKYLITHTVNIKKHEH